MPGWASVGWLVGPAKWAAARKASSSIFFLFNSFSFSFSSVFYLLI
jgi:hypothetical protein